MKTLETLSRKTRRAAHLAAAVATARAWRRAPPRPLHARALFAPTPNPPPRPMVPLVQASGLPPLIRSPPRGATQTVLSRRASVRGGRCGAAHGPFDLLDTAGTARTDASFDRRDLLLFSRLGGRSCTAPGGQRLCSHRARSRMHQGVRGSEVGGHRRTCRCRPMLRVLEPVRDELELPVSRLQKRQMVTSTR